MGELTDNIEGIGPSTENKLVYTGIATMDQLREMNIQEVHEATGISPSRYTYY